eukprot:4189212-Amphidinium_carterae.1
MGGIARFVTKVRELKETCLQKAMGSQRCACSAAMPSTHHLHRHSQGASTWYTLGSEKSHAVCEGCALQAPPPMTHHISRSSFLVSANVTELGHCCHAMFRDNMSFSTSRAQVALASSGEGIECYRYRHCMLWQP